MELAILSLFAFLAGLVDAVVGGGGLIQLPALLVTLPSTPLPLLLGTNKFASCMGTAVAALRYARTVTIPWRTVSLSAGLAFLFSFLGARCVSHLDPGMLRPLVVVILFAVLIFTLCRPNLGKVHAPKLSQLRQLVVGAFFGSIIGFYDGFIGPGTGSFLLFVFVAVIGFDFLHASACAKIINLGTNLAALVYFIPTHNVQYELALTMGAANMVGAYVGAHLSIERGTRFIRVFFILVVTALLLKQIQLLLAPS